MTRPLPKGPIPKDQIPDPVLTQGVARKKPRAPKRGKEPRQKKYKLPSKPKDVDMILQALIDVPETGVDIFDALLVDPTMVGAEPRMRSSVNRKMPVPKKDQRRVQMAPTLADIARELETDSLMADVEIDVPPPFRGVG